MPRTSTSEKTSAEGLAQRESDETFQLGRGGETLFRLLSCCGGKSLSVPGKVESVVLVHSSVLRAVSRLCWALYAL